MVSKTTRFQPWSEERTAAIVKRHRGERGPLMPILRDLQDVFGYVDPRAIDVLAEALNLSKAEVYGVVTFYKDFRTEPPGETVVHVCRGEACQSMGAERLAKHAREQLGVDFGGTTADGAVTLEQVFCLGNCALSPAVLVDGRLKGRIDEARFDDIVAASRVEER
jgi:formate dehydrogenase subunit gamma